MTKKQAKVSAKASKVSKKNVEEKSRPKQNLSQEVILKAVKEIGKGTNKEIGLALKPQKTSASNVARITFRLVKLGKLSQSKHADPVFKLAKVNAAK